MRIIAGSRRGAKLFTPEDAGIRPTPDLVRESLFNIIGQDMSGARFLDLFAGTGAVGLEAVSRGALSCTLVDKSPGAVSLCRRNAERLLFTRSVEILQMDAAAAVEDLAGRGKTFDAIFAGPPFKMGAAELMTLAAGIGSCGIMSGGCVFVIQLPSGVRIFTAETLTLVKERKYGTNKLFVFVGKRSSNSRPTKV